MKIKMLTSQAGVDFVRNPGDELDVPDAEAIRMIEAGIAEPVRVEAKMEKTVLRARTEKANG